MLLNLLKLEYLIEDQNTYMCDFILSAKRLRKIILTLYIYCNTKEQIADIFTKPLGVIKFKKF